MGRPQQWQARVDRDRRERQTPCPIVRAVHRIDDEAIRGFAVTKAIILRLLGKNDPCAYQKLYPRRKRGFWALPWLFEFDTFTTTTTLTTSHIS